MNENFEDIIRAETEPYPRHFLSKILEMNNPEASARKKSNLKDVAIDSQIKHLWSKHH